MMELNERIHHITVAKSSEEPRPWYAHGPPPKVFGHLNYTPEGSRSLLVALVSDFWLQGNLEGHLDVEPRSSVSRGWDRK